jgi:hypothetical protein
MTSKKDHGKTASGKPITDDLIGELAAKADAGYDIEETTLPGGYLLLEGTTMADVRRLELELLASEGLKIEDLEAGHGQEEGRPAQQ